MPGSDRYRQQQPDLLKKIADLETRLKALERSPRAGNTSVNEKGSFRVVHPNGEPIVTVGKDNVAGEDVWGVTLRDPNGNIAAVLASDIDGNTQLSFYDANTNPVIKVRDTPFGIQRPALAAFVQDANVYSSFAYSSPPGRFASTSAWTDLAHVHCHMQAKVIRMGVSRSCSVGSSAQIRVVSLGTPTDVVVAGPFSYPAGTNDTFPFEFNATTDVIRQIWGSNYMGFTQFTLQGKLVSGVNPAFAFPYFAINYGGA